MTKELDFNKVLSAENVPNRGDIKSLLGEAKQKVDEKAIRAREKTQRRNMVATAMGKVDDREWKKENMNPSDYVGLFPPTYGGSSPEVAESLDKKSSRYAFSRVEGENPEALEEVGFGPLQTFMRESSIYEVHGYADSNKLYQNLEDGTVVGVNLNSEQDSSEQEHFTLSPGDEVFRISEYGGQSLVGQIEVEEVESAESYARSELESVSDEYLESGQTEGIDAIFKGWKE